MRMDLIVLYTDQLDACHAFYSALGITFTQERHGQGPEHYAANLDGTVVELYPASLRRPATGSLRLGLTLPAPAGTQPHRVTHRDPDGRTIVITHNKESRPMSAEAEARAAVRHAFGDTVTADIRSFPAGNLSITIRKDRHTATLDGHPDSGWGWSVDPGDDEGFSGHTDTAATLAGALAAIRSLI